MRRVVVLMAGGASRRMGEVKWLLRIGGETVLGRMARRLAGFGKEMWVVLPWNADEALFRQAEEAILQSGAHEYGGERRRVRLIADEEPFNGPLAGLETAFRAINAQGPPALCLAAAADMPFARLELAEALLKACLAAHADAAAPKAGGRLHPLFAVYRTSALQSLAAYRRGGGTKAGEWFRSLHSVCLGEHELAVLDPTGTALFNMNTPQQYREALQRFDETEREAL